MLIPIFCFIILVLILSKGSVQTEVTIPEIAEDINRIELVSFFYPNKCCSYSFAWLYATKCAQFSTLALIIVGTAPVQRPLTPYSFAMVPKAWNTFL